MARILRIFRWRAGDVVVVVVVVVGAAYSHVSHAITIIFTITITIIEHGNTTSRECLLQRELNYLDRRFGDGCLGGIGPL